MKPTAPVAVAIGNFDGVHCGHRVLLDTLKREGQRHSLDTVVLTFDPHPRAWFQPGFPLITLNSQKEELIRNTGVRRVLFVPFAEVVGLTPREFVSRLLMKALNARMVIVGHDFHFGRDRRGTTSDLQSFADECNFGYRVVPPVTVGGRRVSSTLIRELLQAGRVSDPLLRKMLKRRYSIDGEVVKGKSMGRLIGFPTVNVHSRNSILPRGVFETRISWGEGEYTSVTNIGNRPTLDNEAHISVETHIPGFSGNLYGHRVRVLFVRKIREEKKFQSTQELARQIRQDVAGVSG